MDNTCIQCGATFKRRRYNPQTCSQTCHAARKSETLKRWRNVQKRPAGVVEATCIQCKLPFIPVNPHRKICSDECRGVRYREAAVAMSKKRMSERRALNEAFGRVRGKLV